MLQDLVDKTVLVRLKWGETEYKGRLVVSCRGSAPLSRMMLIARCYP